MRGLINSLSSAIYTIASSFNFQMDVPHAFVCGEPGWLVRG